jgi:hypothetical protein
MFGGFPVRSFRLTISLVEVGGNSGYIGYCSNVVNITSIVIMPLRFLMLFSYLINLEILVNLVNLRNHRLSLLPKSLIGTISSSLGELPIEIDKIG